jgi:anaerobic selenocysteine-containing dehydrogenase
MMKINRRDFLKIGAGAGTAIVLGGGFWKWSQFPSVENLPSPGVEKWVPTVCAQCLGGCGILARVIDGLPVNIAGNPLHPVNRGTLCPKGIAGLQGLYDPDRIRSPLKRAGRRGEGRWEPISWGEALRQVSESLKNLRQTGEPHLLAVMGGRYRGLMRSLWERFLEAFGSPNYVDNQFMWEDSPIEGLFLTQGIYSTPAYDFRNARYILSFGSGLLESFWSPVQALSAYGYFRRGKPEHRGRLVQLEPRLSVTAIKADEWIPTYPGTEGLAALGIANMIIKEGLYDKDFLGGRTFGFESWRDRSGKNHLGFKEWVLSEYEPGAISKQTGIPVDTLIRLAREFAENRPSVAFCDRGQPFHQMAVSSLNGLVGSIDRPGGILVPRMTPIQPLPPFEKDPIARKGLRAERIDHGRHSPMRSGSPYLFAKNVIAGKPYKPKVLFLYYTNPLFNNPDPGLFEKTFAEIPFIASFSPYMDDSTRFADLILPDHTPLERWEDDPVFLDSGSSVLGLRQPVVKPFYQTKATGDALLQITKSLGAEIAKAFPWKDFKEVLLYGVKGVFDAGRGDTFGLPFDQAWTRLLERGGWWAPSYKTFDDFWKLLQEKGGWWDPVYDFQEWDRIFRTPSRKFEFYAQSYQQMLPTGVSTEMKDSSFLPHWEKLKEVGNEKDYPLHLNTFRTMALTGSRNANQPWLQAIAGEYLFERWETWAEIHPETAKELGISDRDLIWVESSKGRIKARARLYKGTIPKVVSLPVGEGHQSGGRWATGFGENPCQILSDDLDPLTGHPVKEATRVRIYKA